MATKETENTIEIKPVVIHDLDKQRDYTLEFNRDTIKFAESRGFILADCDRFSMTKIPEFFWYAFRMHHPSVSLQQAENILDRMGGMSEALAERLGELWRVPFDVLTYTEGEEKNVTVTMDL